MKLGHAIGFDDAPFSRTHRGNVRVIGTVYAGTTLHGVLSGVVRRDGANSARVLSELLMGSTFHKHVQLVFLQGVALAGFNVVDAFWLHRQTGLPVLIVARRQPDYGAVRRALLERVPGGARKWRLIQRLGAMQPVRGVWVQRVGLSLDEADMALQRFTVTGLIPEPLRAAHLIAGGVSTGHSHGRT
ncbi:DUF99 family protein [Deinococcus peraridilitoris]|uniref:Uncharacterized protein n=1 Tax=Deinococcus peraridilitoris (strain DSM 19664 / LMG 22246 / CIP 109416 / KR-200) TaxID=937777 RepID=K9ZXD5_DEIPD|nr:DUF99 family protein [Deinococcus peraridilitoris]AFZ66318.1 hypothetical protein Deipe_0739 [Deinococcus peraridilitoris DSM 19664]